MQKVGNLTVDILHGIERRHTFGTPSQISQNHHIHMNYPRSVQLHFHFVKGTQFNQWFTTVHEFYKNELLQWSGSSPHA